MEGQVQYSRSLRTRHMFSIERLANQANHYVLYQLLGTHLLIPSSESAYYFHGCNQLFSSTLVASYSWTIPRSSRNIPVLAFEFGNTSLACHSNQWNQPVPVPTVGDYNVLYINRILCNIFGTRTVDTCVYVQVLSSVYPKISFNHETKEPKDTHTTKL